MMLCLCVYQLRIGETGEVKFNLLFAAKKLAQALSKRNQGKQEKYVVIVNKSTVPLIWWIKHKKLWMKRE